MESRPTKATPDVAICGVNLQNGTQVLDCVRELIAGAQNASDALHGRNRPLVMLQSLFVALHGTVKILHLLRKRTYMESTKAIRAIGQCDAPYLDWSRRTR